MMVRNIPRIGWNYLRVRGEYPLGRGFGRAEAELPPRARRIRPSV